MPASSPQGELTAACGRSQGHYQVQKEARRVHTGSGQSNGTDGRVSCAVRAPVQALEQTDRGAHLPTEFHRLDVFVQQQQRRLVHVEERPFQGIEVPVVRLRSMAVRGRIEDKFPYNISMYL